MATSYYNPSGVSSIVFGAPSLTGYLVQGATKNRVPNLVASAQNHVGQVVARRYDDITETISFDAIILNATVPVAGSTFSYDGSTYEVTSVDETFSNTDFKRISVQGVKSEYI